MSHIPESNLREQLDTVLKKIKPGERYFHYKNPERYYEVIDVGMLEESEKVCIVYKSLYGERIIWVRDLDMWDTEVLHEGKMVQRFQKV